MKKQLLNLVMCGMLVFGAGGAWAQDSDAPVDAATPAAAAPAPATPAAEPPATIPAPELNVNVAPPPAQQPNIDVHVDAPATAPPTTVILDNGQPNTSTTTNISRTETKVIQQPAEAGVNPWLLLGIGLAVLVVLLFVAMAFSDRKDRTVVAGRGTSVTTVR